jgi:pimeloyl-ACP methyl ester carboxylesterase
MAHGLGATKDSGLLPFAEAFAEAGLDALLFDYRCFGESSGEPRQLAWPSRHREDYRAAVEFARGLDGVDPEGIVLWGTSWSGGHVVYVAASDRRIAAVISQTPDLDGFKTLSHLRKYAGLGQQLRLIWLGLKDAAGAIRDQPPLMIPTVAPPGELGAMTTEESVPGMRAIAGPSWRNELTARAAFAEWTNRAITRMEQVRCPILVQIADRDSVAPAAAARAAAWRAKGRVEVREYPCPHFDVYQGGWRERVIADQLHFLGRHLGAAQARRPASLTSET